MKRRIYKKWLKNPLNKRLIWKFCKPFNRVPIAVIGKDGKRTKNNIRKVMKWRIRKKAYDCAHHVNEDFLVTDDPYPIHNTEDYCKLGKYDNTWLAPEKKVSLCEHCKRFCASRPMIRKQRERKAFYKEMERDWNKNYRAAVLAGVAQEENGVINLDLLL